MIFLDGKKTASLMKVLKNIKQLVTLKSAYQKNGRYLESEDASPLSNAGVVYDADEILWVGPSQEMPSEFWQAPSLDCSRLVVVPEVVDCHTHLLFGGSRAKEYTMRLNGTDYGEIARKGGGILSTMKATRSAEPDDLFQSACKRIERLHSYGIGTIEIKSGYGLSYDKEYEASRLIEKLKAHFVDKVQILNTCLAAHAVAPEFTTSGAYLEAVVLPLIERLANEGCVDAVDIFHEKGYFNSDDAGRLYEEAHRLGIPLKCHADEFADSKAALLACTHGALSADHLLNTDADGIEALSQSETVAVMLPGTGFFLGKEQAKARLFLDAGCKVAIGSDYNPGSCHFDNVLMCASMAAPLYQMNIAQLWSSITLNAAHALSLKKQGAIVPGLKPRFSFFYAESFDEITYHWGHNLAIWPEGY